MLTNEEVIQELLKIAKDIADAKESGTELGLTDEEMAFYDALTKPEAIRDFYENDQLVALTKELTETLRKNQTIDWYKKDQARARMRMMIKKLLKKYDYPPNGREDAVIIVMQQCELWADKVMMA
jgi:type I restriction enzyme R subunit